MIEDQSGNIVRATNALSDIKDKKNRVKPSGFIIAKNKIYLALNNGRLLLIDIATGKQENIFKLHGSKISEPCIFNGNMYLIKNKAIIKTN